MIRNTAMALLLAATFNVNAADQAPAKGRSGQGKTDRRIGLCRLPWRRRQQPGRSEPEPRRPACRVYRQAALNLKPVGDKPALRDNAIMAGMAAGLSDEDIRNLAAYFSQQKLTPAVARTRS